MACLLTMVAVSVHCNPDESASRVRTYGWILSGLFAKDVIEAGIIFVSRLHLSLSKHYWKRNHGFLILPRILVDCGSMCIVYVIRGWRKDEGEAKVNVYRICMVVFVVMRFFRLFSYLQAANWLQFGVSSIALFQAVINSAQLGIVIAFVMVAFGTSYHMLPFTHSIGNEILMLFNDGIMGEPSTEALEDVHPSYAFNAMTGAME